MDGEEWSVVEGASLLLVRFFAMDLKFVVVGDVFDEAEDDNDERESDDSDRSCFEDSGFGREVLCL